MHTRTHNTYIYIDDARVDPRDSGWRQLFDVLYSGGVT